MARHRRWPIFAMIIPGLALVVGSFAWDSAVAENLVKYPTDLDSTTQFEGKVMLYVDPETKAPLAEPQEFPLSIERHVFAVPGEASNGTLVLREDVTLSSTLFESSQSHQYVVDRRTGINVADPRAWSYRPEHAADRSGAYRLVFGFDVPQNDAWTIYKDETDGTYTAAYQATGDNDGVSVYELQAAMPWTPVNEDYLAGVSQSVALPREMTLEQMKPLLASSGLDTDAVLMQIAGGVSPEDLQALLGIAGAPIPLQYVMRSGGSSEINNDVGIPISVSGVNDTLGVTPASEWVTTLTELLGKYPENEGAVTLSAALASMAGEPIPVFANEYTQTPASVANQVSEAKDSIAQKTLAEETIPTGMLWAGVALTVIGAVLVAIPKKRGGATEGVHAPKSTAPADTEREPELV